MGNLFSPLAPPPPRLRPLAGLRVRGTMPEVSPRRHDDSRRPLCRRHTGPPARPASVGGRSAPHSAPLEEQVRRGRLRLRGRARSRPTTCPDDVESLLPQPHCAGGRRASRRRSRPARGTGLLGGGDPGGIRGSRGAARVCAGRRLRQHRPTTIASASKRTALPASARTARSSTCFAPSGSRWPRIASATSPTGSRPRRTPSASTPASSRRSLRPSQEPVADGHEIVDVRWLTAERDAGGARRKEISLRTPTIKNLQIVGAAASAGGGRRGGAWRRWDGARCPPSGPACSRSTGGRSRFCPATRAGTDQRPVSGRRP